MSCAACVAIVGLATAAACVMSYKCPKNGTWPCKCNDGSRGLVVEPVGASPAEAQAEVRLAGKQLRKGLGNAKRLAGDTPVAYPAPNIYDKPQVAIDPYTNEASSKTRKTKAAWA